MAGSGSWRTHTFLPPLDYQGALFQEPFKNDFLWFQRLEHMGVLLCVQDDISCGSAVLQQGRAGREWSSVPANEVSSSLGSQASSTTELPGRDPAALCSCSQHSSPCDSSGSLCPTSPKPGEFGSLSKGTLGLTESRGLFVPMLLLLFGDSFRCPFFGFFCLESSTIPCFEMEFPCV